MSLAPQPDWPTLARYDDVTDKLSEAHDAAESLTLSVKDLAEESENAPSIEALPAREPTLEDVGALWSFRDGLRLRVAELSDMCDSLDEALSMTDAARLTVEMRRRPREA